MDISRTAGFVVYQFFCLKLKKTSDMCLLHLNSLDVE